MPADLPKLSRQVVGNVGLFHACYRLSRLGWNVLPTSRNARGVDVVIYSQEARRTATLQVKALSKKDPVPLGNSLDSLVAQYVIVCSNVATDAPECFVMTTKTVRQTLVERVKKGAQSYWLERREYEPYRERWNLIGEGFD